MGWGAVNAAALAAETAEADHGRRVVRVLCDTADAPELWHGTFGNAPVESGPAGFVLSDGEVISL